ncbi:cytochrome P450 [Plantactinospora endophytica]|uniref:Cytochrome P450 n=1 Tax=Plantactinospora endophytica TaxID=673535 RepID=A0ABQ4E6L3_9ACTN|nr:cytochrome P450 [Plantactinospora endophytica]GIG90342.1 cytochrome P450 [Plantactinospora endophytica]
MTVTRANSLLDLFESEWIARPYELYSRLREQHPVYWDDLMRTWVVLTHAEVAELSKDNRLSGARIDEFHAQLPAESQRAMAPLAAILKKMMLFTEPPEHTRLRKLIRANLSTRFIRNIRSTIEQLTDDLLDRVVPTGRLDVIHDFSEPLTRGVIAMLAGVPPHAEHLLEQWRGLLPEFFSQSDAEMPRLTKLREVFDENAEERRAGIGDDLFTQMVAGQLRQGDYTDDEVFANFLLLIDAGQATTTNLIGNAALALLEHPDQAELLRRQPDLAANAAHEFLRYDSSVQFTTRIALSDVEVAGKVIRAGESVALVLGAGNRDPLRYPDPDRLDLTRKASDHLSFGHGIHYCLGAVLAQTEIEIAMRRLVQRTTNWRVDGELGWLDSINFRFLRGLPLHFDPRDPEVAP